VHLDAPKEGKALTRVRRLTRQLQQALETTMVEAIYAHQRGAGPVAPLSTVRAHGKYRAWYLQVVAARAPRGAGGIGTSRRGTSPPGASRWEVPDARTPVEDKVATGPSLAESTRRQPAGVGGDKLSYQRRASVRRVPSEVTERPTMSKTVPPPSTRRSGRRARHVRLPGRLRRWWRLSGEFRNSNTRVGETAYSWHISSRIGAAIAEPLVPRRVSANQLTLLGMGVTIASAGCLATFPPSWTVVLLVTLGWQLGYGLDCADGQLARARGESSAFGAWLDQCADFVSHVAVFTSLTVVVARHLTSPAQAGILGGLAVGANLFALFASSQRNSLLGTSPAPRVSRGHMITGLMPARELADWGGFLLVGALSTGCPALLLILLVLAGSFQSAAAVTQLVINWPTRRGGA
jgi:phosphatidylglycerophosphate synthase